MFTNRQACCLVSDELHWPHTLQNTSGHFIWRHQDRIKCSSIYLWQTRDNTGFVYLSSSRHRAARSILSSMTEQLGRHSRVTKERVQWEHQSVALKYAWCTYYRVFFKLIVVWTAMVWTSSEVPEVIHPPQNYTWIWSCGVRGWGCILAHHSPAIPCGHNREGWKHEEILCCLHIGNHTSIIQISF